MDIKINIDLIKRIDLVYTAFPIGNFNELTEKRLQSFLIDLLMKPLLMKYFLFRLWKPL